MTWPGAEGVQLLHSSGISCYPNPAGNTLHIQTADHRNTTAELCNILGQRVTTQPLTGYITDLNLTNLTPGTYFLRLLGANNQVVYTTQVVKQ